MLFGATFTPFILNAVLLHHLQQYQTEVADNIKHNLYVNNIISECLSKQAAAQYYQLAQQIMNEGKFNLCSWASNSFMLNSLSAQEAAANTTPLLTSSEFHRQLKMK